MKKVTTIVPFKNKNIVPIYGVPGAGKTTKLIDLMRELLEGGTKPAEIAFASFTKTASYEGRDRAATALGIAKNAFKHYATIHSLCYRTTNPKPKALDTEDYKEIAGYAGDLSIRGNYAFRPMIEEGTQSFGLGTGDQVISLISLARSHMIPLEEILSDPFVIYDLEMRGVTRTAVINFNDAVENYKHTHNKVDFSDMLELGIHAQPLPVKYAFVDEAQDLTNLQWLAVDNLFRNAETIYIGGDDDQAIYDFSGGNSEVFRAMGDNLNTLKLEHSHRCPRKVFEVAEQALTHIENRVPKQVIPQDVDGEVSIVNDLRELADQLHEGEWLFLVRQHSHAAELEDFLRRQHYFYRGTRGGASIPESQWAMIKLHERIRRGEEAYATELGNYYMKLKVGHCVAQGSKTNIAEKLERNKRKTVTPQELVSDYGLLPLALELPWYEALLEIPLQQREYIQGVLERGERARTPRIKVSTIHAAKGTQAENVVICARVGKLSRDSLDRGKLDEYRAAYVAITRAQKRLFLWMTLQADDWCFYRDAFHKIITENA